MINFLQCLQLQQPLLLPSNENNQPRVDPFLTVSDLDPLTGFYHRLRWSRCLNFIYGKRICRMLIVVVTAIKDRIGKRTADYYIWYLTFSRD